MIRWLEEAEEIKDEIIALRRDLHAHPEVGNAEYRTTEVLEKWLNSCGIETQKPLATGLYGILHCAKKGGTVMLRSDIDALPVEERTGLPFSSVNPGVMHACGHDIHMSALCGAAKLLAKHKDELAGNVVFVLQPDEEQDGGAERMMAAGALEGVEACFGAHINPALPAGTAGIRYGKFYAAAVKFDVVVHGKGSHGAEPENGIDALYAAAIMCQRLKELTGIYDGTRAVVTVGTLHSGTVRNILNDTAVFTGIIRTFGTAARDARKEDFMKVIHETEAETGVTAEVTLTDGYPGVVNHDAETELAENALVSLLGRKNVSEVPETMTTEDFGYYILEKPGCFYHLGAGSPYPLHSPMMNPDERAVPAGAAAHAAVIEAWLNAHAQETES